MTAFPTPSLRRVLRANATFALATGLVALVMTGPVARLLGVGEHRLVSVTGAGLLLFAAGLGIASGARTAGLIRAGRLTSLADGLWLAGSAVVVIFAGLPARGDWVVATIAAVVTAFAVLQMRALGLVDETARNQAVEVSEVLDGRVGPVPPSHRR